jgi:hypothetical protein
MGAQCREKQRWMEALYCNWRRDGRDINTLTHLLIFSFTLRKCTLRNAKCNSI